MNQLIGHGDRTRPAQALALVGVMLVVGILYIRHAPEPDAGTELTTLEVASASPGPSTTLVAASGADRLLPATAADADADADADAENGTPLTTIATVESISLYAVAAKAAAQAAEAEARETATTVKKKVVPVTTTTTTKPATSATTTTTKPAAVSIAIPPTTTTTITATPGVYGSGQSESGNASWFAATNGTCAHRTLPFGTIVKITRLRTGATATCRVNDRGPSDLSRLIDLSDDVFESLAPMGAGLMPVKIEW